MAAEDWLGEEEWLGIEFSIDWHMGTPRKGWRDRNRVVHHVGRMSNRHLLHALRLASTKGQHESKLEVLGNELFLRGLAIPAS